MGNGVGGGRYLSHMTQELVNLLHALKAAAEWHTSAVSLTDSGTPSMGNARSFKSSRRLHCRFSATALGMWTSARAATVFLQMSKPDIIPFDARLYSYARATDAVLLVGSWEMRFSHGHRRELGRCKLSCSTTQCHVSRFGMGGKKSIKLAGILSVVGFYSLCRQW